VFVQNNQFILWNDFFREWVQMNVTPNRNLPVRQQEWKNFITITDHNTFCSAELMKDKHPDDVIIGVESTTYFPEDRWFPQRY